MNELKGKKKVKYAGVKYCALITISYGKLNTVHIHCNIKCNTDLISIGKD